ncbi:hypothetical protein ACFFRR_002087 [Megaselia abdita]
MVNDLSFCRVCLRKSRDAITLDAVTIGVFNTCTNLKCYLNDGFANQICLLCHSDLKIASRFLERAKDTDKKLRDALARGRSFADLQPIKEENDEIFVADIKPEFINCSKDPLEDSEAEINQNSDNEKPEIKEPLSDDEKHQDFDGDDPNDADYKASDSDDEEFNKPLKEIKKESKRNLEDSDSSDSSNDEFDDFFATSYIDDIVNDAPNTPENAIFPKGRYMCKVCKKTYFTEQGLKSHITIHLPKPRRKKNKNDSSATESKKKEEVQEKTVEVDAIVEDHNGEDNGKTLGKKKKRRAWACHVCGKNMISASKLRYHMVMHTGEKDFLCTQCPKAYSTIYALQHHMRTHTGERPYECIHCGDKFTRPTTLKSHMRRHTGERPYGCDICGKRFIQHSSMTTHMKLNHMEKKINCPHCDKKYARQSDLNMHLVSHTGDKPFSCNFCPSRFIRQANLNKHISGHHSESVEEKKPSPVPAQTPSATLTSSYNQQQQQQPQQHVVPHQQPTPQPLQPQQPPHHMNLDLGGHNQMQHHMQQQQHMPQTQQQPQHNMQQQPQQQISQIVNVPQVEQQQGLLTNLLGNAIDPDRGRSMDDILRWGWPSNS